MLYAYMITCLCDYVGMECSSLDVDWILEFLVVLLERHLINAASNRNYSSPSGLSPFRNEIRRCLCDYVLTWNVLLLSIALGRESLASAHLLMC